MTYNEFYHLQIGDIVKINSSDITYGDSCVMIIIDKKLLMQSSELVECVYYCKMIYPSEFQGFTNSWYDSTSLILCMDERNAEGTFVCGYVDANWSIGYARCRDLGVLTIFKGDI